MYVIISYEISHMLYTRKGAILFLFFVSRRDGRQNECTRRQSRARHKTSSIIESKIRVSIPLKRRSVNFSRRIITF